MTETNTNNAPTEIKLSEELRENVIAIQLVRQSFGKTRTMNANQKAEVAEHFNAERRSVTGSKKLYPARQPQIKAINSILTEALLTWEKMTVGYLRGVRLLRKETLPVFVEIFEGLQDRLDAALAEADNHRDEILAQAKADLGAELFDINDYPSSFSGSVAVEWSVYNFEPSEELFKLAPATYEREKQRVAAQFQVALAGYETEMKEQLGGLIDSLLNSLQTPKEGKRQVFKEATANNLRKFFDNFEQLNIGSDAELKQLVADAKSALSDTTMKDLKASATKRQDVGAKMQDIKDTLTKSLVDAPARSIDLGGLDD